MRADRLISLMMLLQTRGQMTAEVLAKELSVSKRTIYRDIDALSGAGVPIYADGGPGGGYALIDSYRTSLNGLNQEEIRSLFLLITPGPLSELGISQSLNTAILKLTSALPDRHYDQPDFVRRRFHLDSGGWFQSAERVPHLGTLQEAVWSDRQIQIFCRRRPDGEVKRRLISPLGLVAKSNIWYLVADTEKGRRVYRVSRVEGVEWTSNYFTREPSLDLVDFWNKWVAEYEASLPQYPVTIRVGPDLISTLPYIWGEQIRSLLEQSAVDAQGWRTLNYTFERKEEAQARILGLGAAVEVLAPDELRTAVQEAAQKLAQLYSEN
jgi:predicted DNA-binding transcriptional regulator YafY